MMAPFRRIAFIPYSGRTQNILRFQPIIDFILRFRFVSLFANDFAARKINNADSLEPNWTLWRQQHYISVIILLYLNYKWEWMETVFRPLRIIHLIHCCGCPLARNFSKPTGIGFQQAITTIIGSRRRSHMCECIITFDIERTLRNGSKPQLKDSPLNAERSLLFSNFSFCYVRYSLTIEWRSSVSVSITFFRRGLRKRCLHCVLIEMWFSFRITSRETME